MSGAGDTGTGQRKDAHVARMSPNADRSLTVAKELKRGAYTSLKNQWEFNTEAIGAATLSADSEDWVVQVVQWVGFGLR